MDDIQMGCLGRLHSWRTRPKGPAKGPEVGGVFREEEAVVGPWPIGCSSLTSLYHSKSAEEAVITYRSQRVGGPHGPNKGHNSSSNPV